MNEWLALLRVHEGGVTKLNGHYLNHGRAVAGYVADALDELIRTEFLALARPDPVGAQQVCVTRAGQIRYVELNSNGVREGRRGGR
ncbi:MAG: hypothetical protein LC776_06475 [Acidobacteria bacterium]|nr:hypothetical protein [Acidobacteriota bacterium]